MAEFAPYRVDNNPAEYSSNVNETTTPNEQAAVTGETTETASNLAEAALDALQNESSTTDSNLKESQQEERNVQDNNANNLAANIGMEQLPASHRNIDPSKLSREGLAKCSFMNALYQKDPEQAKKIAQQTLNNLEKEKNLAASGASQKEIRDQLLAEKKAQLRKTAEERRNRKSQAEEKPAIEHPKKPIEAATTEPIHPVITEAPKEEKNKPAGTNTLHRQTALNETFIQAAVEAESKQAPKEEQPKAPVKLVATEEVKPQPSRSFPAEDQKPIPHTPRAKEQQQSESIGVTELIRPVVLAAEEDLKRAIKEAIVTKEREISTENEPVTETTSSLTLETSAKPEPAIINELHAPTIEKDKLPKHTVEVAPLEQAEEPLLDQKASVVALEELLQENFYLSEEKSQLQEANEQQSSLVNEETAADDSNIQPDVLSDEKAPEPLTPVTNEKALASESISHDNNKRIIEIADTEPSDKSDEQPPPTEQSLVEIAETDTELDLLPDLEPAQDKEIVEQEPEIAEPKPTLKHQNERRTNIVDNEISGISPASPLEDKETQETSESLFKVESEMPNDPIDEIDDDPMVLPLAEEIESAEYSTSPKETFFDRAKDKLEILTNEANLFTDGTREAKIQDNTTSPMSPSAFHLRKLGNLLLSRLLLSLSGELVSIE